MFDRNWQCYFGLQKKKIFITELFSSIMIDWLIDWLSCVFAVFQGGDFAKLIGYEIFKFPPCKKNQHGLKESGDIVFCTASYSYTK